MWVQVPREPQFTKHADLAVAVVFGCMATLMCFMDEKASPLWATHFEIVQNVEITAKCGYVILPSTEGDSDMRVLADSTDAMKAYFNTLQLEPEELAELTETLEKWGRW